MAFEFDGRDDWIKHEGDELPVEGDVQVEVILDEELDGRQDYYACIDAAKEWLWHQEDGIRYYRTCRGIA